MIQKEGGGPNFRIIESRQDGFRILRAVSFHDMPGHERNEAILKVIGSGDNFLGKSEALLMPKVSCGGEDLALDLGICFPMGEGFDLVEQFRFKFAVITREPDDPRPHHGGRMIKI